MSYAVKEIFYTLQGEGAQTGRPAVFCRFAGCNLWSGREQDRASAICQFCDTDFADTNGRAAGTLPLPRRWQRPSSGIGLQTPRARQAICRLHRRRATAAARQGALIDALHACGFEIAVETNGTIAAPAGLDWICVSPKAGAGLKQRSGDELKLVYPSARRGAGAFEALAVPHFFLQPMDGPVREPNTKLALDYCLDHPRWRLSLQTHKMLGIP